MADTVEHVVEIRMAASVPGAWSWEARLDGKVVAKGLAVKDEAGTAMFGDERYEVYVHEPTSYGFPTQHGWKGRTIASTILQTVASIDEKIRGRWA